MRICPFHLIPLKIRVIDYIIKTNEKSKFTNKSLDLDDHHIWIAVSPVSAGHEKIFVCPKCAYAEAELK